MRASKRLRREVLRDLWVAGGVALLTTVVTVAVLIGLNKLLQRYVRDRESAERALREANQHLNQLVEQRTAELTELSQHLIRVSEEEKAKLARELHDTLGSNLTAINMDLNWIQRRLPEGSREVRERLQRVLQMLAETVELKHEVIEGLRPSHLDNLGLAFAMRSHCREFTRRTGLPCDVDVHEDFDDLDPAWSIALYRIAQEALTNITKHAQATPRAHRAGARAGRRAAADRRRRRRAGGGGAGQAEVARRGRHARAHAADGRDASRSAGRRAAGARSSRPSSRNPPQDGLQRRVGSVLRPAGFGAVQWQCVK